MRIVVDTSPIWWGRKNSKRWPRKNLEAFSKVQPKQIVTTCAGCYKTFKELYPKHLSFNTPVLHAIEYLDQLIQDGKVEVQEWKPDEGGLP